MELRDSILGLSICGFLIAAALVFAFRAQQCRTQRDSQSGSLTVAERRALAKREKRNIVLAHICGLASPMPIPPLFLNQFIELLRDIEMLLAVGAIAAVIAFSIKKLGDIELRRALKPIYRDMAISNWVLLVAIGILVSTVATIGVAISRDEPLKKEIISLTKSKE